MRNAKWFLFSAVAVAVLAVGWTAQATTYNLKFGAPYAAGSSIEPSTAAQYSGAAAWFEQYPSVKTEIYVDPATQFGTSFTIDQIQSINYHTVNGGANPSGVDFYLLIYTALEGSDNDAGWYNKRLNAEPYLTNGYVAPTNGVWNTWSTDAGVNQLTLYDANNCGNFGFYGAPTLGDLQAGPINWSTWPGNPTQGASDPGPKDYGAKTVLYLNWSTGSGWPAFAGYLDAIEVNLTNGDTYVIDLEAQTDPVYVDDDWAGSAPGIEVEPGKFYGWNAFDKVQDGVSNVSGSTVYVAAGTYEEQVEIAADMTIQGSGVGATIIKSPVTMTKFFVTSGPNNNYPVVYAHDAADVIVRDLTVDGAGRGNTNYRMQGFGYRNAGGTIEDCEVKDIRNTPIDGGQHGVGIYAYADNGTDRTLNVLGNSVDGFQKNGMALTGANLYANVDGNTVTGAGAINFIAQNGIQVSTGASADLTGNTVSGFAYTPYTYSSAGLLIFDATSPIDVIGNTVDEAMVGIWFINCDGTVSGNSLTNTAAGMGGTPYWWQIVADPGVGVSRQPKAQPFDDGSAATVTKSRGNGNIAAGVMALSTTVTRNTVAGGGNGSGIEADALGTETLTFTATENQVSGCEASFVLYKDAGATLNADLYNNASDGSNFGIVNQTGVMQDASGNWWGDADPIDVAPLIDGGNIDYTPWLGGGADTDLGTTGFQGDFSVLWADDDSPQTGADNRIQEAVDMVSGSTVYLAAGTYVGQVVISGFVDLDLIGAGIGSTILNPPATAMPYNYTTPSNNRAVIAIVNSDDVDVSDLTVDGLGLGNINNRFIGIAFFESGGSVADCEVNEIRNTPIDGVQGGNAIYAYNFAAPARAVDVTNCSAAGFQKGGIIMNGPYLTTNVTGCDINGYGPASFIAMNGVQLGFGAVGSVVDNQVYGCSYTGAGWVSAGVLLYNAAPIAGTILTKQNLVEDCQVGIYYINVGGNCDSNTVTASAAGTGVTPFWNIVLDPGTAARRIKPAPTEENAPVSDFNRLAAGISALTSMARWNALDGAGDGYGLEVDAYSPEALTATIAENSISNFDAGLVLWEEAGATLSATVTSNSLFGSDLGFANADGTVNAQFNTFANLANADDNTAGNYYNQNCWSDYNGVGAYPVGGTGANVDNNPNTNCGLEMSPDDILYLCSGELTFDVAIGAEVAALDAAKIHFTYPAEFTVTDVVGADPNYFVFFTQTSLGAGQIDTLKVDLGVLVGVEDGPATLYTVKMSGSTSCLSDDIEMVFRDLRDSTNSAIIVPLSGPIHVATDCVDPDVAVTAPAPGGIYSNASPLLDIASSDDCALEDVYYQLDGCVGAGWVALGAGLSGTTFNLTGWAIPGYAGLADGLHCLYFKAVDDQGRMNGDTCAYSWCFTKDATPPPPPTNLVATPGHNKVHLSWVNAVSDFDHTVVMRTDWYAGGHEYPEYDDNNPEGPYPPDILTGDQVYSSAGTTHIDTDDLSNATRDVYHYSAFTVDAAGNVSAPSNAARSTSYWLGDVTDNPMSVGNFDGYVYYQDLAIFSTTFGLNDGDGGYENDFDIGPTYNGSPRGIPTTDNAVQFEDLAIFAINFDAVNPAMKVAPIFAATNTNGPLAMGMLMEETASDELTVRVVLKNNPDAAKSIHFVVPSTASGLKLIEARLSEALSASVVPVFFNGREVDGRVDVSLALLGGETSIGGSGELAVLRMKRTAAGPLTLAFDEIDLRDGENNRLNAVAEIAQTGSGATLPTSYALAQNYPNPFNAGTVIRYQVPSTGDVSIIVYNITGQVVKILFQGLREQGQYNVAWDGRDESGNQVASGMYLYRINAGSYTASRKMVLVK